MSVRHILRAGVLPRARGVRMYHPISTEEVLRENAAYEARINEAEEALSRRGFPRTAIFRQPVVWGEHDQYQHVNNAHYIRWFESARMRWIERMSRTLSPEIASNLVRGRGVGIILASTYCRYRRPVTYPDTVVIGQAALPMKFADRVTVRSQAYSVAQSAIVAEADFECVAYDYDRLCKASLPPEVADALRAWTYTGEDKEPYCQKTSRRRTVS